MKELPISVVIICRNSADTMRECMEAIKRNKPTEIVVVDGNSTDNTMDIAREYTERIYSDGGRGMGYASQMGTEKATQEYIAYVDSDVVLAGNALATMLSEFKNSNVTAISARQLPEAKRLNYWEWATAERCLDSRNRRGDEGYLGTLACLFRRDVILNYGFDIKERYLHDYDLEIRLRNDGSKFGDSSAIAYHHHRFNFKSFTSYRFFEGKVCMRYMRKWGPWRIRLWPPLYTPYWIAVYLVKGKFKLIPYVIVDGTAQTMGMINEFLRLTKGSIFKKGEANAN